MIFTTILITCFFALAGVMQAPMADTFLLSLTVLSQPSLSAVSNIFTITRYALFSLQFPFLPSSSLAGSPMLVPTLPLPAVLEPYSDLLLQVTIPFNLPSKALGLASSTPAAHSPTYSPTPRDDTRGSKLSLASRAVILLFIVSATAAFSGILCLIFACMVCANAIFCVYSAHVTYTQVSSVSTSSIKDQLLSVFESISTPRTIVISDYAGLAQTIGYTLLLDDSSLPAHDDVDSFASGSLAASTSLYDILFGPVSIESICMPINEPAPLSQQIHRDVLACTTGWSVFAGGILDDSHQVLFESLETGEVRISLGLAR